jgi:hypothetical protein
MLFPLNNDTLILFFEKNFFVREINVEKRLKLENTQKVPIVVPKVAFLGPFGTTIELFANETYLSCVILTPIQYAIEFQRRRHRMK